VIKWSIHDNILYPSTQFSPLPLKATPTHDSFQYCFHIHVAALFWPLNTLPRPFTVAFSTLHITNLRHNIYSSPYNWTWKDCWTLGFGGEMNGFVLWISGLFTGVAHSAGVVLKSSLLVGASDFDRDCKAGFLRGVAGEVFLTISVSHWSAFGSGVMVLIGTFCGVVGGELLDVLITDGDGVLGKVSAMLLNVEDEFADTATTLLYLDGIIGGSSISCLNGVAVPIGMNDFAIDETVFNGR
jgi:hypothetical protein